MNDIPASGPIARSNNHHARDTASSRNSLFKSHRNADLRECKKHLLQIRIRFRGVVRRGQGCEFLSRALAAYASAVEQHETVAEARGLADLMNEQTTRT